jgi:hypothetical protein
MALAPVLSTDPSLLWSYFHVHLPTIVFYSFFLSYSFLHIGTPFFGQKSGVSPVFNPLWEPAASSRLVGGPPPPQGCEIPLRLDPPVRRMDLVQFNYVDRSIVGPQPVNEGMGPVVSICNNGGVHRSPPLAPVVTINSVASVVSASGGHNTPSPPPPAVAFRVRHDAGAGKLYSTQFPGQIQAGLGMLGGIHPSVLWYVTPVTTSRSMVGVPTHSYPQRSWE